MMSLNGAMVLLATFLLTASLTQEPPALPDTQLPVSFDLDISAVVVNCSRSGVPSPGFTKLRNCNIDVPLVNGQVQFECFNTSSNTTETECQSSAITVGSIEECCVQSDGLFYRQMAPGDQTCLPCIVFGFFDGPEIRVIEQGDVTILEVGFIKGAPFEEFLQMDGRGELRFTITVTEGTAVEGPNADFTVPTGSRSVTIDDATMPASIQTLIRVDRIALELPEDFSMTLMGANAAARAALAAAAPNQFSIPNIRVVIEDSEAAVLQFTESDYSNVESAERITPSLQLLTNIATNLTVVAVPVNYTFLNDSGSPILNAVPEVPNFDPRRPIIAASDEDFSSTELNITFLAGNADIRTFEIEVEDDDINEVEQLFVVFLRVVDAVNPDRVDLTGRFATLGRIIDDDPLVVGFEQMTYTFFEANATFNTIPIIKGGNQRSELTFSLRASIIRGSDANAAETDQSSNDRDILAGETQDRVFRPDQQSVPFQFELIGDFDPEPTENFQVELSLEESGLNVNLGGMVEIDGSTSVLFSSAQIVIIDDDAAVVTIGWERNFTAVNESQGFLELCVIILDITGIAFPPNVSITLAANTISGTAADPGDYVPLIEANGDIFFSDITADNNRSCIAVFIEDDDVLEETENFSLQLVPDSFSRPDGLPPNFILEPDLTFVEIMDNDFVRIGFREIDYAVNESDPFATVTVAVLENSVQRPVRVSFSTEVLATDTATAGADFTPGVMELLFNESIDEIDVMIPIIGDSIVEGDETFTVSLVRDPMDPLDEVIISPDEAIVVILDDDRVTIGFEETEYTVTEGVNRTVQICAVLISGTLERGTTVTFSTSDGSAMAPEDYTATTVMFFFDRDSTRSCVNVPIITDSVPEVPEYFCGNLNTFDAAVLLNPDKANVTIIDAGVIPILVNDTVIGDPLFTVPVYVPDIEDSGIGLDSISLCYEIHGQADEWFNLVTDECTSVNAHYIGASSRLNVINRIAIRAVDGVGICREILIQRDGCTVELDGIPLNGSRFDMDGIMIRRYSRRVRVAVPNCQEQNLVMWITCETTSLYTSDGDGISVDSIRFDIMRGLNVGHRDSHGIIGQFWNVPVELAPFSGTLRNGAVYEDAYTITVARSGSPTRVFTGQLDDRIWDRSLRPCLYAGNQQAGAIYEVLEPNDPVIEGTYASYRVPSAFDETDYQFSRFEESMCLSVT